MDVNKYPFLNRDLSWLSFNHRVLMEAADESVPLFSRISFLSIFSSNLDEFFRVRMPAIFAFTSIKGKKTSLREEYPKDLVQQVQAVLHRQLEEYGSILTQQILPSLKENHICLYYGEPIHSIHLETIREYFLSRVLSFLQPVILHKGKPNEVFLENNALYFIADLECMDEPEVHVYAVLNIPSGNLPRFLPLPSIEEDNYILFLDDVIRENLQEVFRGYRVHGAWSVKVTRDAEMVLEDEFAGDIAEKIEKQLEKREVGHSTRFLFDSAMPEVIKAFIQDYFLLRAEEMVGGGRYHNLRDLGSLPNPFKGKLVYPDWPSVNHPGFDNHHSVFKSISQEDKLLHLPYHSYNTILRFFNEAAIDPNVKEISVTLYRVASDSHIVNALISAARNGKKVTVFVELKARFDEANNLRWSKRMKSAGIKIINSLPGLKVHAKVALVKRMENHEEKYYSLLATGNFNEATGRFYTDHVFFTANEEFSDDLQLLFGYLKAHKFVTSNHHVPFKHILVSQFNMVSHFYELIDREIKNVQKGKPGRIIIKVNNLQERGVISRLYTASQAGVKVDLIVRSICCAAPGLPEVSENITVHRLVDRYLEHARIFVFHNNGETEYFMGSADWMSRNLYSRIEVCFPIYDKKLGEQVGYILDLQMKDNKKAVFLTSELENVRKPILPDEEKIMAQEATYEFVKSLSSDSESG
ncbi:MAG: polyphosphate kinase 1 [Chitinophagaceae bacterium]|nr:polyphosphate kinase 1 [Chitinophagaceae bacterium]